MLLDEYIAERTRRVIAEGLGWIPSPLDLEPHLVAQTDDILQALRRLPSRNWPPQSFWMHWVNLARVWGMVAGRADAGSPSEQAELDRWAAHQLIDAARWGQVRSRLAAGYEDDTMTPRQRLRYAASSVFTPIELLGRAAWASSAPARVARFRG